MRHIKISTKNAHLNNNNSNFRLFKDRDTEVATLTISGARTNFVAFIEARARKIGQVPSQEQKHLILF